MVKKMLDLKRLYSKAHVKLRNISMQELVLQFNGFAQRSLKAKITFKLKHRCI